MIRKVPIHRFICMCAVTLPVLSACNDSGRFMQRPRSYFKFELPKSSYVLYDNPHLVYSFEIPTRAKVVRDTSFFYDINDQNPNWINIEFKDLKATIYVSYIPIKGKSIYKRKVENGVYVDSTASNSFDKLLRNSYSLVYKHTTKASQIKDSFFTTPHKISGTFFDISGNTATKYQFFVTDTINHYLRGVLYFDSAPNEDSLRPLNQLLVKDMQHMINTLQWRFK